MGFRACVWDLDGTLLYTLPTIHHYCNQSLRHFGFHDITLDECRDLCRLSIAEFYHKLLKLGGCPPDRVAALQPAIRDYDCAAYLSDFTYLTQPYAGPHRDPLLRTRYFKRGARFRAEPPRHQERRSDE